MKPVTSFFLLSGASLAVLHFLSIELNLYWRYLWLDMPIHALGGATVALAFLSLREFFPRLPKKLITFKSTMVFVLFVALVWEVFEVSIGVIFEQGRYVPDTTADIMIGFMGGMVGYYVGKNIGELDRYG